MNPTSKQVIVHYKGLINDAKETFWRANFRPNLSVREVKVMFKVMSYIDVANPDKANESIAYGLIPCHGYNFIFPDKINVKI